MVTQSKSTLLYHMRFITLLLLLGIVNVYGKDASLSPDNPDKSQDTYITVFVHGIMSIKPHVSVSNFFKIWRDDVENSVYSKTVEYMRDDPVFYQNQAMQMPGLHPIYPHDIEPGNASGALAFTINSMENQYNISPQNSFFYTFGWSGLLSAKQRFKDSQRLFEELEQVVAQFREKNIEPKIRLYGYSHGGNVLLNLASVKQKLFPDSDLKISELVLLGTPIQSETDYLINDSMFERVFHHYSEKDRVQWLDFFSSGRAGFSNQKFRPRNGFILPEKLTQIKLRVLRPARNAKNNDKKISLAANISKRSNLLGRTHLLRDNSPGHVELWFFPWTPQHYRKSYALHPFPTVAYAPIIDHHAKSLKEKNPIRSIVADIRPDYGIILLRNESSTKIDKLIEMPKKEEVAAIGSALNKYAPQNYSGSLYNKHTQIAFKKAGNWFSTTSPRRSYARKKRRINQRNNNKLPGETLTVADAR